MVHFFPALMLGVITPSVSEWELFVITKWPQRATVPCVRCGPSHAAVRTMKFLCLAYGAEKDWNDLSKSEQDTLLVQDEAIRKRGTLMAAVRTSATTVRAWDGTPTITEGSFTDTTVPLAGFSVIEADDINEVIRLVANTPCARAKGAIEIRPILVINDFVLKPPIP